MANRTYSINIDVNTASINDLESELNNINDQLRNVERNSQAFNDLAAAAQEVTTQLDRANQAVQGFTAEDKIQAADGAIKVFGGSLQTVVGTLGLIGVESEAFGELEKKAASAIAVGTGLKDFSEGAIQLGDALKKAGAAAKIKEVATKAMAVAQRAFNAVVSLNPVGLLIIALTTAGALVFAFRDKITDLIKTALGPLSFVIDGVVAGFNSLAVAVGIADDAQTKLIKNSIKVLEDRKRLAEARGEDTILLEKAILAQQAKLLEKGTEEYEKNEMDRLVAQEKYNKKRSDENKAASDKAAEQSKAASDKAIQAFEAEQEKYKSLLEKFQDEEENLLAKTDQEKLDLEKKRGLEEIDALKVTQAEKDRLIKEFNDVITLKQEELTKKETDAQIAKDNAEKQRRQDLNNQLAEIEAARTETLLDDAEVEVQITQQKYQTLIDEAIKNNESTAELERLRTEEIADIRTAASEAEVQRVQDLADKQKAIQQELVDFEIGANEDLLNTKLNILAATADALAGFGEESKALAIAALAIQKGVAVADVVNNANRSIGLIGASSLEYNAKTAAAYASAGPAGAIISAAKIAKNTALTAKRIAATKALAGVSIAGILASGIQSASATIKGGGGGGGESGGGGGGAVPTTSQAPVLPQLTQGTSNPNQANQIAQAVANQMSAQPIKTYVSTKDLNTAGEFNRLTVGASKL
jgi:hypothetical protein